MTHYDRLMDSLTEELYLFWKDGNAGFDWDVGLAEERSLAILRMVEEFQQVRVTPNKKTWRASD